MVDNFSVEIFDLLNPGRRLCRSKRRVLCALTLRTIERLMTTLNPALAKVLKRLHYPLDVMLTCVRWYAAYPLSLRIWKR